MVRLIDERRGTDKSIPQMILAGASCDDVFVIVLFSIFTSMAQGGQARAADFIGIPLSIVLGIALGAAAGLLLALFFRSVKVRGTAQLLILLSLSFLLPALETALKGRVPAFRPAGGDEHGVRAEAEERGGACEGSLLAGR